MESIIKLLTIVVGSIVVSLLAFDPSQVITNGFLAFMLKVLTLAILFSVAFSKKPSVTFAMIGGLNPFSIFVIYSAETHLYLILLIILVLFCLLRLVFLTSEAFFENRHLESIISLSGVVVLIILEVIMIAKIDFSALQEGNFGISPLTINYFEQVWLEYWQNSLLLILFIIVAILFAARMMIAYLKDQYLTLRVALFITASLSLTLLTLPLFSGDLISPQFKLEKPTGWDQFVEYMGGRKLGVGGLVFDYLPANILPNLQRVEEDGSNSDLKNIWVLQHSVRKDNYYFEYERDLTSRIAYLSKSNIVSTSQPESDATHTLLLGQLVNGQLQPEILRFFGINQIVVIEENDSTTNSLELESLLQIVEEQEWLGLVDFEIDSGRVFVFEVGSIDADADSLVVEGPDFDQYVPEWQYEISSDGVLIRRAVAEVDTMIPQAAEGLVRIMKTDKKVNVELVDNASGQLLNLAEGEAKSNAYYVAINDRLLGGLLDQNQEEFDLLSQAVRSVRLYQRYSNGNLLELVDFAGAYSCGANSATGSVKSIGYEVTVGRDACIVLGEIKIETSASAVVEILTRGTVSNGKAELCLFDSVKNQCLMKEEINNLADLQTLSYELTNPTRPTLQLRLLIDVPLNQNSTIQLKALRLNEYELIQNNEFPNQGLQLPTTLKTVKSGEAVSQQLEFSVQELNLATFRNCELKFMPTFNQQVELTNDGLEINSDTEYCLSLEVPVQTRLLKINNDLVPTKDANIINGRLILLGSNNLILNDVKAYTW